MVDVSLQTKEDGEPGDSIRRICELVDGPVSAEDVSEDAPALVAEGRALAGLDVFFFQAEDGIRDIGVTGVQTCALPIFTVAEEPAEPSLTDQFRQLRTE